MDALYQKFQKASEEFIKKVEADKDIIGIVLTGSFIHGHLNSHSDLDIYLILHDSVNYRERGNTWVNDVEIEYFKNSPRQIRSYFKKEITSPHTAHMLANGKVVLEKSSVVGEIVEEAKKILSLRPAPLKMFQLELLKYKFDDLFKDLADEMHDKNGVAFQLIKREITDEVIHLFCKIHQIRRQKNKRLTEQLAQIDPSFVEQLEKLFANKSDDLEELKRTIEKLLGEWRPKEWKLRSDLDL